MADNGASHNNSSYNSMSSYGPSFSHAEEAANIKQTLDNARADQTNNNRLGVEEESYNQGNENSLNSKPSELEEKEGLDSKEGLNQHDAIPNNNQSVSKNNGLLNNVKNSLTGKGNNKSLFSGKKSILSMKIKIIIALGIVGFASLLFLLMCMYAVAAGFLSLFEGVHINIDTINEDDYNYDTDKTMDEFAQEIDDLNNEELQKQKEEEAAANAESSTTEETQNSDENNTTDEEQNNEETESESSSSSENTNNNSNSVNNYGENVPQTN